MNEIRSFFSILKILIRERPDVVHLNSSKAGGIGALTSILYKCISLRFGVRTVFTVHGWSFLEDHSWLWRTAAFIASWLFAVLQDTIIVIDQNDLDLARYFVLDEKLVLIPNGIDRIQFEEPSRARVFLSQKVRSSIPQDRLLIGTIAELTPTKGLIHLLDAAEILQNSRGVAQFSLIIIGNGEQYQRLADEINRRKLQDSILLAGEIPHAARYLTAFDIFVLPSLKEGLPYAVMEAMMAGLPVVASAVGGLPDLLANETGILIEPKNSKALAETLLDLLNNTKQREELGRRAKEASQKFSLERMMQETIRAYRVS
jgi:glycosyltransferase involved in cell wall biosynthesis